MTLRNITTILIGLALCFCLFSKTAVQSYQITFEVPSVHDVLSEEADVDDALNASDDLILIPIATFLPVLFLVLPVFFSRHYSPPIISPPKRPPSF